MKPYYLSRTDGQRLFAIYHPPTSAHWRDRGVVLCYPYGNEYMRAHRAFVRITDMLNKAGFPVLRFDYYGTGDSEGDSDGITLASCRDDIQQAVQALRQVSGASTVSLLGLRLGASLALSVAGAAVDSLVLWDPVIDGRAYIEQTHKIYSGEPGQSGDDKPEGSDFGGCPANPAFMSELSGMDLCSIHQVSVSDMFLITSQARDEFIRFKGQLDRLQVPCQFRVLKDPWFWGRLDGPMLWSLDIFQAITGYLSEATP